MNDRQPLLRVQQLSHRFASARDAAGEMPWAVHEASLELHPGEVLAIVGES